MLEKRVSELERNEVKIMDQLDSVKKAVNKVEEAKMKAFAISILEVYGNQADVENIVTYKSVENGERIDSSEIEPTCTLVSKYPKVRVFYRIKNLVESEANTKVNGNTKQATNLFRILYQNIFPDPSFWVDKNAKLIISENEQLYQACITFIQGLRPDFKPSVAKGQLTQLCAEKKRLMKNVKKDNKNESEKTVEKIVERVEESDSEEF